MAKKKLSNTKDCAPLPTMKSSAKTDGRFQSAKQHPRWCGSRAPELVGKRFGFLEIMSAQLRRTKGHIYIKVRCHSSGQTAWRSLSSIESGASTSLHRNGKVPVRHAEVLGRRYDAALARCTNPLNKQYPGYGGRGIKMMFPSPMAFILWVAKHLPAETYAGVEIDRRSNDGHYAPGNLRLASRKMQQANRRNTARVSWAGRKILLQDWASPYGPGATYRYAIQRGMTGEEIIVQARKAVQEKRRNWQGIAARLASMTL